MIKLIAVAGIILVGVAGSSLAQAASYSSVYSLGDARGTLRHHRSEAVKLEAIQACGADRNDIVANPELPSVLRCLRAQGWVVARVARVEVPASSRSVATAPPQDDDTATSEDDDDDSADVANDDSSDDDSAQQQFLAQQNSDLEQEELNAQQQSQQQMNDALLQSAEDSAQQ